MQRRQLALAIGLLTLLQACEPQILETPQAPAETGHLVPGPSAPPDTLCSTCILYPITAGIDRGQVRVKRVRFSAKPQSGLLIVRDDGLEVTTGKVTLNGVDVVSESALRGRLIREIRIPVPLKSSTDLTIEVKGVQGSAVTVWIDALPPASAGVSDVPATLEPGAFGDRALAFGTLFGISGSVRSGSGTATVSSTIPQVVYVLDEDYSARGMTLSLPGPAGAEVMPANARTTALATLYISPGIIGATRAEAEVSINAITSLACFPGLVQLFEGRLPTDVLRSVVNQPDVAAALTACAVEYWTQANGTGLSRASLAAGNFTTSGGGVTFNVQNSQMTISNAGWRHVSIHRRNRAADGSYSGWTQVTEVMKGATQASLNTIFSLTQVGTPTVFTDAGFSSNPGPTVEYWYQGLGFAQPTATLAQAAGLPQSNVPMALTIATYGTLPLLSAAAIPMPGASCIGNMANYFTDDQTGQTLFGNVRAATGLLPLATALYHAAVYPFARLLGDPGAATACSMSFVPGAGFIFAPFGAWNFVGFAVSVLSQPPIGMVQVPINGGFFSGRVVIGTTLSVSPIGVPGALVRFRQGSTAYGFAATNAAGVFTSGSLAEGVYDLDVVAPGYVSVTVNAQRITVDNTTTVQLIPLVLSSNVPGGMTGHIRNARTGQLIGGITVELRGGINSVLLPPLATATSDASGAYSFTNIAPGTYSITGTGTGYASQVQTGIVVGSQVVAGQDLSLLPTASNDIRIVLTWGANPQDLDSHLTGPTAAGSRFHVYYPAKGSLFSDPFAALDIDDVTSFGPETITISQQLSGVYRYSVHDYWTYAASGTRPTNSTALANSGARVQLFMGDQLRQEFFVPNQPGTLWTVFELNGTTLTPINRMGYTTNDNTIALRSLVSATDADSVGDAAVIGRDVADHPKP